jgi:transcriptional regulator with XRE-family HTH domain
MPYIRQPFPIVAKSKDLGRKASQKYQMGPMLALARERANMTQVEAAKAVGIHPMTLSEWERGASRVDGEKLPMLLRLYRVTLEEIGMLSQSAGRGTSATDASETSTDQRVGEAKAVRERPRGTYGGEVMFTSPTAAQKGRTWMEQFLLELAEAGAPQEFIDSSRRLLLNAANYEHGFGAAAGSRDEMEDEEKLRHMQALAVGIRAALKERLKRGRSKG